MAKKKKKKNELSHYPSFFFSKLVISTISWIVFAILFVGLGKKYVDTDILGKVYNSIFDGKINFNQYFLGVDKGEKSTLLSYAIYFLIAIVVLNIISLWVNRHLWKKDRYIENNNYYLHNKWVFILNSLIHIASTFLLIFSFVSAFTVILALLFISFNTWNWFPRQKELRNPQTESFFSWKNQYVRKMLFYSAIVMLVVPLIIGRFRSLCDNANSDAPSGLARSFNDVLSTSPTLRKIVEILTGPDFSLDLLYWFILFWFALKDLIGNRWKEFGDFWTKVNGIERQVSNFKCYYYYQESWALDNNKSINLGDYKYLENSPNFLRKDYLGGDQDVNNFAQKNQKVIKYIGFCENKIKKTPEKNFLNYCLFNEFDSWEDCLRTKRLIKSTRKQ